MIADVKYIITDSFIFTSEIVDIDLKLGDTIQILGIILLVMNSVIFVTYLIVYVQPKLQ